MLGPCAHRGSSPRSCHASRPRGTGATGGRGRGSRVGPLGRRSSLSRQRKAAQRASSCILCAPICSVELLSSRRCELPCSECRSLSHHANHNAAVLLAPLGLQFVLWLQRRTAQKASEESHVVHICGGPLVIMAHRLCLKRSFAIARGVHPALAAIHLSLGTTRAVCVADARSHKSATLADDRL